MNIHDHTRYMVRNGAGQLIRDRRASVRRTPRRRTAEQGAAVVAHITLALLDETLTHPDAGCDPYDAKQGHSRPDVWGSKRRD
jgi:hypothetical protein